MAVASPLMRLSLAVEAVAEAEDSVALAVMEATAAVVTVVVKVVMEGTAEDMVATAAVTVAAVAVAAAVTVVAVAEVVVMVANATPLGVAVLPRETGGIRFRFLLYGLFSNVAFSLGHPLMLLVSLVVLFLIFGYLVVYNLCSKLCLHCSYE